MEERTEKERKRKKERKETKKGKKYFRRDRLNKIMGPFKDGIYDSIAINGKDITLTIDSKLQQYGEYLMKGKRRSKRQM